jgi:hypothetical protein
MSPLNATTLTALEVLRRQAALVVELCDAIGSIPCFFGGFYPGRSWSCCR